MHKGKIFILLLTVILIGSFTACSGSVPSKPSRPGALPSDPEDFDPMLGVIREAEFREQVYNRQELFEKLDGDSDGFLSVEEYNGTPQLFADMDIDGDEQLSPEEAQYMMTFADIPAGSFIMGTDTPIRAFFEPATDSGPAHEVTIDAFKMAATEITNAQYVLYLNSALEAGEIVVRLDTVSGDQTRIHYPVPAYVVEGAPDTPYAGLPCIHLSPIPPLSHIQSEENGLLIPEHPLNQSWLGYTPELEQFYVHPGFEDWPAAYIKWWGAMAFAEHYGLSLPTEAEWEYVASGGQQFAFPTSDGANNCQLSNYKCYNVLGQPDFQGADTPDEYVGFRLTSAATRLILSGFTIWRATYGNGRLTGMTWITTSTSWTTASAAIR
jgi:formylglycine-generating enzyme required for sulfatase activity